MGKPWIAGLAAFALGGTLGLGLFTFGYARGDSYLTDDPAACANCHLMAEHYGAWVKSSHRAAATCNDCHTPASFPAKYFTKARNGFWHSLYFTVGGFPEPLRITPANRRVTESACRHCHAEITEAMDTRHPGSPEPAPSCARCHRTVGHWVR